MKPVIRTPYFEIGTKNYIYGDKVLEYALAADRAAEKYDIDVLFITPAVEIRRVVEHTKHLIVLAPYMDTLRPGRGMADILPEALAAAGAQMVLFSTGRGTPFGCPVPTIKIASNSPLAKKKANWIDFNAGRLLDGMTLPELSDDLFDLVLAVAGGAKTRAEAGGFRDLAIFKTGVTL